MNSVAIDPLLWIWDEPVNIYDNSNIDLAADIVSMYSLIEEYKLNVIAAPDAVLFVINSFPCGVLAKYSPAYGDFINTTYSFLSKVADGCESVLEVEAEDCVSTPSLMHGHYEEEVLEYINSILHGLHCNPSNSKLISKTLDGDNALCIRRGEHIVTVGGVPVFRLGEYLLSVFGKLYELNEKHDPKYGWGSRLPENLTDEDLQYLLGVAIPTSAYERDSYVVFSEKGQCYLRYRRHFHNKFHAYPVAEKEVESISGITLDVVPRI